MSAPKTLTTPMVRVAVRSLCAGGQRTSNAMLYAFLDLQNEKEKDRLRTRVGDMVKAGELVKVSPGLYEYNFKYRLRDKTPYTRLWRCAREANPGWSFAWASLMVCTPLAIVERYYFWLEKEGYIERCGKDAQTFLYRATGKADRSPEPPYPPHTDNNPFEQECEAAAMVARAMFTCDPYRAKVASDIVAACKVLMARFDKSFTENENAGEKA